MKGTVCTNLNVGHFTSGTNKQLRQEKVQELVETCTESFMAHAAEQMAFDRGELHDVMDVDIPRLLEDWICSDVHSRNGMYV